MLKQNPMPARKHIPVIPIIFAGLIILAIGGLAGWKLYQTHEVSADNARFVRAEKDIDELSRQIVTTLGAPAKTESNKDCSRPHLEIVTTQPYCEIESQFYYSADAQKANDYIKKIRESFSPQFIKKITTDDLDLDLEFKQLSGASDVELLKVEYKNLDNMNCRIAFRLIGYKNRSYSKEIEGYTNSTTLNIGLSCGDYAKSEHYPMKS